MLNGFSTEMNTAENQRLYSEHTVKADFTRMCKMNYEEKELWYN